jgi:MFS superfamily sulfate permease-like transporter
MRDEALTTDQAKNLAIILVVGVIVVGLLISWLVGRLLARLVVLVIATVLVVVLYTQRGAIQSAARRCEATFFGVHLTPSDPGLKQRCQQLSH